MLKPISIDQERAPENQLEIFFCTCKTGCGVACGCRKHGLPYITAYLEYNGFTTLYCKFKFIM